MAANDELARGLTLTAPSAGPNSLVYAAVPGIAWTLTSVDLDLLQIGAIGTNNNYQWQISITSGGVTLLDGDVSYYQIANESDFFTWNWSGRLTAPLGQDITIAVTNTGGYFGQGAVIRATAEPA